jgi:hypothetical protein
MERRDAPQTPRMFTLPGNGEPSSVMTTPERKMGLVLPALAGEPVTPEVGWPEPDVVPGVVPPVAPDEVPVVVVLVCARAHTSAVICIIARNASGASFNADLLRRTDGYCWLS